MAMNFLPLLAPIISDVIKRVIPDPAAQERAQMELLSREAELQKLVIDQITQTSLAQAAINKEEAAGGWFRASWRPLIGYVLGLALAFQFLINPLLMWANVVFAWNVIPPEIALDERLWELMFGVLGLAGIRTYEKIKGGSNAMR